MTELPQTTWNALAERAADLRAQRDQARADLAERDRVIEHLAADRDECVGWCGDLRDNLIHARADRDEARAQAVAATTDADDLRGRVRGLADEWDRQRTTLAENNVGRFANAAVRICANELRAALDRDVAPRRTETGPVAAGSPETATNTTAVITGPAQHWSPATSSGTSSPNSGGRDE